MPQVERFASLIMTGIALTPVVRIDAFSLGLAQCRARDFLLVICTNPIFVPPPAPLLKRILSESRPEPALPRYERTRV